MPPSQKKAKRIKYQCWNMAQGPSGSFFFFLKKVFFLRNKLIHSNRCGANQPYKFVSFFLKIISSVFWILRQEKRRLFCCNFFFMFKSFKFVSEFFFLQMHLSSICSVLKNCIYFISTFSNRINVSKSIILAKCCSYSAPQKMQISPLVISYKKSPILYVLPHSVDVKQPRIQILFLKQVCNSFRQHLLCKKRRPILREIRIDMAFTHGV